MSEHMRIALWFQDESETFSFGRATLALDGNPPIEERFGRGPVPIKGTHLIKIDTDRTKIQPLNAAKLLHVRAGDLRWTLKLGSTAAAIKALAQCERDLLVKWGMDPVVLDSIETPPMLPGGLVSIFRLSDYPQDAILANKQGTTGVRFWIGTNGKVSDCRVVETSGSARLDGRTCGVITRRARYVPAKTKSGKPVPSIGFQRVRWERI